MVITLILLGCWVILLLTALFLTYPIIWTILVWIVIMWAYAIRHRVRPIPLKQLINLAGVLYALKARGQ